MVSLARGASAVRRAALPTVAFGAGYGSCWALGREETAPQLAACGAARCWVGLSKGLRMMGRSLPDAATWPKEKLLQVEATELRVLAGAAASCAAKGLDSAALWRVVLQQLCEHAEADPRGLAAAGLAGSAGEAGDAGDVAASTGSAAPLASLAAELDQTATALSMANAGSAEVDILPPFVTALQAVVEASASKGHEELAADGALHLTRAALVATGWLAAAMHRRHAQNRGTAGTSSGALAAGGGLSAEDEQTLGKALAAVWQALGSAPGGFRAGRPGRGRSEEALAVYRDVERRYAALQARAPPPTDAELQPHQDALPLKLRRGLAAALRGGGRGALVPASGGCCGAGAAGAQKATPPETKSDGGSPTTASKVFEYAPWALLFAVATVALSEDGMGCLPFHALPTAWRTPLRGLLLKQSVRVEELLAKYDEPGSGNTDSIILGPWGAQSTYIQVAETPPAPPMPQQQQ